MAPLYNTPTTTSAKVPKLKTCPLCGKALPLSSFAPTKTNWLMPDGYTPFCNSCALHHLQENEFNWEVVDAMCRSIDIPFIVKEWERLAKEDENGAWVSYVRTFKDLAYEHIDWKFYFSQYKELRENKLITDEIPLVREEQYQRLRKNWGANYDDETLLYLEELYRSLLSTQNINSGLQDDQARKLCKISYEIDTAIAGTDPILDKLLSSYDKLVKIAEFTPRNAKNASDFDSVSELMVWLEKRGWLNKFYDGATRDVIDETIKNIQSYNQKLYVNESGISEDIQARLAALQNSREVDTYYDLSDEYDLEEYDQELYQNEEFELTPNGPTI